MSDIDDMGREELIFPEIVDIIRRTHEPWTTDKNGNEIDPEWEQTSIVRAHDLIVKLIEAYARDYAVRELEALVANHLTDDGVRRYVRLHNFEESITRLKGGA